MHQLLTISPLQKLDWELRRWLKFYAPLTESLDFWGVDPATYSRAGTLSAVQRGGTRTIAANVPPFEFDDELPLGVKITAGAVLQFGALNDLDDASSLIWVEEGVWKSTPTDTNPFANTGVWSGNVDVHVKHVVKAKRALANSEINAIQIALEDTVPAQVIPPPAPTFTLGTFITETPTHLGNGVYQTSQAVDLTTLLVFAHGGIALKRVASDPEQLQFTAGGTDNRTITPGLVPVPPTDIWVQYAIPE